MPHRTVADNVSRHLARYLADHGLTQTAFAQQIGRSQPTVSRWLNGNSTFPASELLFIASTIGVKVSEFYEGVEPVPADSGADRRAS